MPGALAAGFAERRRHALPPLRSSG
jgi:hypothetical protein